MPFDNLPYSELMERHGFIPANHAQPQFFPVAARRLFDDQGNELEGWKRIVNEETNKTLHVATDSYQVVDNKVAFGAFEDALRNSALDLTDMQIGTDYAAYGARCFRQYLLPAHQVEVRPGNVVALRIIMMNSYDGSMAFRGQTGAYSFICANTSILGTNYGKFSFPHRSGTEIDVTGAAQGLITAAEAHVTTVGKWKRWPQIEVSDENAIRVFRAVPVANKSLVDHLVHAWVCARNDDGPQGGGNAWALYNVLTAWSSHGETGVQGGRAGITYEREGRVAKVIEGQVWRELLADAA
jgi:hypothetical protein